MNYMAIKNENCPQHCFKLTAPLAFNANGKLCGYIPSMCASASSAQKKGAQATSFLIFIQGGLLPYLAKKGMCC